METGQHPRLRSAPLRAVICQLRFPNIPDFGGAASAALHPKIKGDFPNLEPPQQQLMVQIGIGEVKQMQAPEQIFRWTTANRDSAVTVGPNLLSLETTNYRRFDDFLDRWLKIVRTVVEIFDVDAQTRIGLRYINQVPLDDASLEGLRRVINEDLLGPIGAHPLLMHPLVSLQEARFRADGHDCTIRHGVQMIAPETAVYLVDVDVYADYTEETAPLELDAHIQQMRQFNENAYELFLWSVTEKQFNAFAPITEGDGDAARTR